MRLIVALILLAAAFLQGAVGFGYSLLALICVSAILSPVLFPGR